MNLVVDIGNTAVKMAVFQQDKLLNKMIFPLENFSKNFSKSLKTYPELDHAIVSNVSTEATTIIKALQNKLKVVVLDSTLPLPFTNLYKTSSTLGKDRLALVAAAVLNYPETNVLTIDVGTCVTYDIKTKEEQYLGGAISPGLGIRFKGLHKFTANLPLVQVEPVQDYIGTTTYSNILSGVVYGLKMEILGVINSYQTDFEDLTIILTGGDSQILSIPLKNSIFANSNFLLEGLNFILEFNKTQ